MTGQSDNIYDVTLKQIQPFAFDVSVASVFEDMIRRSVPGYGLTLQLMASIANDLKSAQPVCYDLGCSLGAGMVALDQGLKERTGLIYGIDTSEPMLERAQSLLKDAEMACSWDLKKGDVREIRMQPHDLSVLNFTLQFIELDSRLPLLNKIYEALKPGGYLLLSEKVVFDDSIEQEYQTHLHHNFKRLNGYSDLEISQKRTALENRLIPETAKVHMSRLKAAGFSKVFPWLQAFNFMSFLAVK